MIIYILVCAFLFSWLDWKVIHITRWTNREWLEWMHAHERTYALITGPVETILCAPALALKPIFSHALMRVEASKEEQEAITHAPYPDWKGFYHSVERGKWTFVPWWAWFLNWIPRSLIWYFVMEKLWRFL